ncbi:MAG: HEAT repeat domain-containing protein [Spirochaetales bacterium]|jgi:HEAT repeat protein|nr:HEAT repeat domain-containing protein [Spirochaetales bacterium]
MENGGFYESFKNWLTPGAGLPVFFILAGVLVLVLAGAVFLLIKAGLFRRRLKKLLQSPGFPSLEERQAAALFRRRYPEEKLVFYSWQMERCARLWGRALVGLTGMDRVWIKRLQQKPGSTALRRVLLFCPPDGLFIAFLAVLKNPRLRKVFIRWKNETGEEETLRLLARACRGEEFDASLGGLFGGNVLGLFQELTGESEWYCRYFAYRVLLRDTSPKTLRAIEDGIFDPHPLIRKTLLLGFKPEDEQKSFDRLWDRLIHDPVFEVREAAKVRIQKEFSRLYAPAKGGLADVEAMRVLELLDPLCQADHALAMAYLEEGSRELCYPAAAFLEKCGALDRLLAAAVMEDSGSMERTLQLLRRAAEVQVTGFLNRVTDGLDFKQALPQAGPVFGGGSLLIAARLLAVPLGTGQNINHLAEKVFEFFHRLDIKSPSGEAGGEVPREYRELYELTIENVAGRGEEPALELFRRELFRRETRKNYLDILLPRIPLRADYLFFPVLRQFLLKPDFCASLSLVETLSRFDSDILLPEIFSILNGPRSQFPHPVRIRALQILGRLKLPYCLERILESLPTLSPEQIEEFAPLLSGYPQEFFEEKTAALLASPDGQIRTGLLTLLPAAGNRTFLKEIRSCLKDVDPDVRIAAIKALMTYGEIHLLNQETSMLRDPVERVRVAASEVIGRIGNPAALELLKRVVADPNEAEAVKRSAIAGLGRARTPESLNLLAGFLDESEEFVPECTEAMGQRVSKNDITRLIEIFKDSSPAFREKLIPVFQYWGEKAEKEILGLLEEELLSLKPYLTQILEETGWVEQAVRRLSDRQVQVRRAAARSLSLLGTLQAFRGLVKAARDPDQEVRVMVVRALEKLKTAEGREILEKLKDDPDRRIRKYTYWALERLDSLELE